MGHQDPKVRFSKWYSLTVSRGAFTKRRPTWNDLLGSFYNKRQNSWLWPSNRRSLNQASQAKVYHIGTTAAILLPNVTNFLAIGSRLKVWHVWHVSTSRQICQYDIGSQNVSYVSQEIHSSLDFYIISRMMSLQSLTSGWVIATLHIELLDEVKSTLFLYLKNMQGRVSNLQISLSDTSLIHNTLFRILITPR